MSVESKIKLPPNHTPQLCKALTLMESQRFNGKNALNYLAEVRDDLRHMGLTERERDLFELGIYFKAILDDEYKDE